MILLTGATGNTGSQVVHALRRSGRDVRAFVRDPQKARRLLGGDVELAVGDFADGGSVRAALEGVEEVVLSCADDPRRVEWENDLIDAAAAAGVRRVVKLSTIGAEPGAPVAFWDWHGRIEEHLRSSALNAVVLRSSFYMTNLLAAAEQVRQGSLVAPAGSARVAMIDPVDVGAVAAAVLTDGGQDGETLVLTGPEAVTWAQLAGILTAVTGRSVEFVDVPPEAARRGMIESGLPEFVADQLLAIFAMLREGAAETVTGTVEELTGRPSRTFENFARDHAAAFAPVGAGAATPSV
jgi:uncharacterized protein YbjT (DUF2867 family)